MAVWIAVAVLVASILTLAAILVVVERAPRHRQLNDAIDREMQRRRRLTVSAARVEALAAMTRQGHVTSWAPVIPDGIGRLLASLPGDVEEFLKPHRVIAFPESHVELGAEFLASGTPDAVVPPGYDQVGVNRELGEIVCVSRSGGDVLIKSVEVEEPRERFPSLYHYILCEAAFDLQ